MNKGKPTSEAPNGKHRIKFSQLSEGAYMPSSNVAPPLRPYEESLLPGADIAMSFRPLAKPPFPIVQGMQLNQAAYALLGHIVSYSRPTREDEEPAHGVCFVVQLEELPKHFNILAIKQIGVDREHLKESK